MATIKELLSTMIDKINGNEDKINNIKGVPEAFDSITMTNGTDTANLTMSAEKELLFNGEAIGGSGGALFVELNTDEETIITPFEEIENAINDNRDIIAYFQNTYLRLEHYVKNYMDDDLLEVTLSGLSSVNKVMFVIEIGNDGTFSVTAYGIELTEL